MSSCIPKHIYCGTYAPDFQPGNTPCTLQTFNETRSRLQAGNAFFRSIEVGTHTNNIQVSCEWQFNNAGVWTPTTDDSQVERVELIVTNGTDTEIYHADQSGSINGTTLLFEWTTNAIPSLESQINSASNLITMDVTDVQQPWPMEPAPIEPIDHIDQFVLTNLTGGTGGPNDPDTHLPRIRTGPSLSMIHIIQSEINQADGTMEEVSETRYWNGFEWLGYDPETPDCVDIENPPTCP